jgi:hypothetical protein
MPRKKTVLRATMERLRLSQQMAVRAGVASQRAMLSFCQGEATPCPDRQSKILEWLRRYDRRVTLRDIVGPEGGAR